MPKPKLEINDPKLREHGIDDMNALLQFSVEARREMRKPSELVFRGHASADWQLRPSLFRRRDEPTYEGNVLALFAEHAVSRLERPPKLDEFVQWLILARHYGVPTRLLDWTRSPLVGLYFAVRDDDEHDAQDGIIYAIEPGHLMVLSDNPADQNLVQSLVNDAFEGKRSQRVGGLRAFQVDQRIRSQQGSFTIHGDEKPLDDYEAVLTCLRWARIPARKKPYLRNALHALGVRRHELFPDLETLGKYCASVGMPRKPQPPADHD